MGVAEGSRFYAKMSGDGNRLGGKHPRHTK